MYFNFKNIVYLIAFVFTFFSSMSQIKPFTSVYDPQEVFAQNFFAKNGSEFRSANGAPASEYWQNRADYSIRAAIDTITNELSATEIISYINNSPDSLESLWLQVDQNTYRKDARSNFYTSFANTSFTDGMQFESVDIIFKNKEVKADYIINDTRMQIRLPAKLFSKEKNKYSYKISLRCSR
ncbi:MAG: hypothetical protein WDM71_06970 [Ferruginibacter sp.]